MSEFQTIVSFFIIWPIIMFLPAFICFKVPLKYFNPKSFWFREKKFEQKSKFYEKVFLIKKWKHLLPDGARAFKGGFEKKNIRTFSVEYFEEFIRESCRAEATHIPPIFLSLIFLTYNPPQVYFIMLGFALITNLPCIITQRYNRIRLQKLVDKRLKN